VKIAVVGQGYVGLPLAMAAAAAGHHVTGIDIDSSHVKNIAAGKSFTRDVPEKQIVRLQNSGNYSISTSFESVQNTDIVMLCVPTPLDPDRNPDYSFLKGAIEFISPHLKPGVLVIVESTIAPGATRGFIKDSLDSLGVDYDLAYSPERIDPANTQWNINNTPKLVSGLSINASNRAASFYRTFVEHVYIGSSLEVIETAKLLENSFRLINISFINEIAQFCTSMKIDVREVINAAATKPYGFMPFYPGAGIGGHCIPVDPSYLVAKAREMNVATNFIDLANQVNHALPSYFVEIAESMLETLMNKRILVVGVAYKPDVSDVRETPASTIIDKLRVKGAWVEWHDDLVGEWRGEKSVPMTENYDLVILINLHSNTQLTKLGTAKILDTRGGYK